MLFTNLNMKRRYLQIPLNCIADSDVCYVYDLDGTLVSPGFITNDEFTETNIRSQKIVLDITKIQPPKAVGVILTYRPEVVDKETLEQLSPIRSYLHTLYMRGLEAYPHYNIQAICEYKISKLEMLCKTYKTVYFFDDTLKVVQDAAHFSNLYAYHVQHVNDSFAGVVPVIREVTHGRSLPVGSE